MMMENELQSVKFTLENVNQEKNLNKKTLDELFNILQQSIEDFNSENNDEEEIRFVVLNKKPKNNNTSENNKPRYADVLMKITNSYINKRKNQMEKEYKTNTSLHKKYNNFKFDEYIFTRNNLVNVYDLTSKELHTILKTFTNNSLEGYSNRELRNYLCENSDKYYYGKFKRSLLIRDIYNEYYLNSEEYQKYLESQHKYY